MRGNYFISEIAAILLYESSLLCFAEMLRGLGKCKLSQMMHRRVDSVLTAHEQGHEFQERLPKMSLLFC